MPMSLHLLQPECKDKTQAMCHMARKTHGGIGFTFVFVCLGRQKSEDPKIERHG